MTSQPRYVLVGGGLTASRAAEALRENGFDGSIVLIGDEEVPPYERPPLSKQVLIGAEPPESALTHPEQWYSEQSVELLLGHRAAVLDRADRQLILDDGTRLRYDKVLLATGSRPRTLDIPGAGLDGVLTLRTMSDSIDLRDRLRAAENVVVVGGGWIGLEVAAAARQHECRVTVVEPQPVPLHAVMGPRLGRWFADLHRRHGVELLLGEGVSRFEGVGRVRRAVTAGGAKLPADVVVIGVGIVPNTELAGAAGLEVDNGIRTDASLRTADPAVFAAGDVACFDHPLLGRAIRTEHWANALHGGTTAGLAMLGQDVVHDRLPYFYTDQYDAGLEYIGHVPRGIDTEPILRGDPESGSFMAFWVADGRILAALHVNQWDSLAPAEPLIAARTPVHPDRLADPQVPIDQVPIDQVGAAPTGTGAGPSG